MRLAVAAAAAALLAGCGAKAQPHTSQGVPPPAATCDNVIQTPITFAADALVQDLGTLAVGQQAQFTIPAGTASFFIVAQAVGTAGDATFSYGGTTGIPNIVVPTDVRGPLPGQTLYYDDWATPPTTTISGLTYRYDFTGTLADPGLDAGVGVFSFPNTSHALQTLASAGGSVEAGTWSFTVNDWAYECWQLALASPGSCVGGSTGGRYRIHVVSRSAPATPTLAVEVYLATASDSVLPDPSTATTNVQVARWKQSLGYYLGKAGITLGPVTFHAVPAAVKNQYAPSGDVDVGSSGPCSDLSQLFTSATVSSRAVNVFLADHLVAPVLGGVFHVAGVDGSIPGPSGFPGTINSGAIVGLENFGFEQVAGACSAGGAPNLSNCGTDLTAYVTAHEIGHWLGLYHVTEQDGTLFDPISDTPVCPCAVCAAPGDRPLCADVNPNVSSPTLVTADRCVATPGCGGGDNLMFWVVSGTHSTGALSPDQGRVMRLNPAVQ